MGDGVASERTQARAEGVRDGRIHDIRNGKKPIAEKSPEGASRVPEPLFSNQLRNLKSACHFVRCIEL